MDEVLPMPSLPVGKAMMFLNAFVFGLASRVVVENMYTIWKRSMWLRIVYVIMVISALMNAVFVYGHLTHRLPLNQ